MTKISVALTNLGKYNEGELVFERLELPATPAEISETLQAIGIDGVRYEEYFISDYEAPFEIGEYDNLDRLNEIAETLAALDIAPEIFDGTYSASHVINFAQELSYSGIVNDADEYTMDIIHEEELDEMAANIAKESGWQRVRFFLGGITNTSEDYYIIDGYGNAADLTHNRLEMIVDDLMYEFKAHVGI